MKTHVADPSLSPPEGVTRFFCEIEWEDRIADEYPFCVVERLIENGNMEAVRWVRKRYGDDFIREVVCRSRKISRRTARYGQAMLEISEDEVFVLSETWRNNPNHVLWPYW